MTRRRRSNGRITRHISIRNLWAHLSQHVGEAFLLFKYITLLLCSLESRFDSRYRVIRKPLSIWHHEIDAFDILVHKIKKLNHFFICASVFSFLTRCGARHKSIAFDSKIKNSNRSRQSDMSPNEPITRETMAGCGRSEFKIITKEY